MKSIWYQEEPYGMKIFMNVTSEYFKIYGRYPRTEDQIPEFLTALGYPCKSDMKHVLNKVGGEHRMMKHVLNKVGGEHRMMEAHGLTMEDETATAFILRFGL